MDREIILHYRYLLQAKEGVKSMVKSVLQKLAESRWESEGGYVNSSTVEEDRDDDNEVSEESLEIEELLSSKD